MHRRQFMALGGFALANIVLAQSVRHVSVGFLRPLPPTAYPETLRAYMKGLAATGYAEGRNLTIEHRWSSGSYEALSELASELVRRKVSVIFTGGGAVTTLAAMRATRTVPIVFVAGDDPVRAGIVKTLARPEANVTGITLYAFDIETKKLEILAEVVPHRKAVGVLRNPNAPEAQLQANALIKAAAALGSNVRIFDANSEHDINSAFATMASSDIRALVVVNDVYFSVRSAQIVGLANKHGIAAIFDFRHHVAAGGLMSYGSSLTHAYEQAGTYTGRVLNGEKPSTLPVLQPSKFELVINLSTARALDLRIPPAMLLRADEIVR